MDSLSNVERFGFVPDDIKTFLARYDIHINGEKKPEVRPDATPIAEKVLGTTERNNLLKLVIGMAVKGYSHDPAAKKSPTPKEIADDLAQLGISIDPDTVRKYLKESANTVLPAKAR